MQTPDYLNRIHELQHLLPQSYIDAFLIDDPINLFYLTGLDLSAGRLLVHNEGAHLLVDSRYFEQAQQHAPFLTIHLAPPHTLSILLASPECSYIQRLGFNSDKTSYKSFLDLQVIVTTLYTEHRMLALCPVDNLTKDLRHRKDATEIAILKEAARLGSEGYDFLLSLLVEGVSEADLAMELEIFWRRRGASGVAFSPIIAFGANSSMPHYRAGNARLKQGDLVLIDIGVTYQHYHSDMTRVAFFGEPKEELRHIYDVVKQAQQAALALCRPGILIGELDQAAREVIGECGYGDKFTHSLGHGIGLEVHEWPTVRNAAPQGEVVLEEGMVITIEPGVYVSGLGGVRLEDTILIIADGHESLTQRPI